MSISSSALLVRFTVKSWAARKLDRTQTDNVSYNTGAKKNAGTYTKDLMAGTKYVREMNLFAGRSRTEEHDWTLPWEDRGDRILPSSLLLDFKTEFNNRRDHFYKGRDYICSNYDHLCRIAAGSLGAMHDPNDYPTADEVYAKYQWKLTLKTVPKSGHLYLDLPAKDLEELREALDQENEEKTQKAMGGAWHRLHGMLSDMSDKLTTTEAKQHWYGSFVDNPRHLCDMLSHLNVTNDPDLERARVMLERTMQGVDIEDIKESPATREDMKVKVDSIIDQFDW